MDRLSELLTRWIIARDRMRARAGKSGVTPTIQFVEEVEGYAEQLSNVLGPLNLSQLESLHDLTGTLLARRRMQNEEAAKKYRRP